MRRKGAKDTLLGPERPAACREGRGLLAPYLGGVDRTFFERMFSLDHLRLQAGGREILEARDDIGQMLFSAAASGIEGLRERLEELRAEADALWTPRRAKHRTYYAALDRLNEADARLRECTLSADRWHELKRALESAEDAYAKLERELKDLSGERARLSRIRRVYRHVKRKCELDEAIASLGEVIVLPAEAGSGARGGGTRRGRGDQHDRCTWGRGATCPELSSRSTAPTRSSSLEAHQIHELRDRRIEIRGARTELPRHEAELGAAEKELRGLGRELGWEGDDPADSREPDPRAGQGRGGSHPARSRHRARCRGSGENARGSRIRGELRTVHRGTRPRPDFALMSRSSRAPSNRCANAATSRDRSATPRPGSRTLMPALERELASLRPRVERDHSLAGLKVPTREQVERHLEHEREWSEQSTLVELRADALRRELADARALHERLVHEEDAVSAEAVAGARRRRDGLWNLVKVRHVDGSPLSEEMLEGYEKDADDLPEPTNALGRARGRPRGPAIRSCRGGGSPRRGRTFGCRARTPRRSVRQGADAAAQEGKGAQRRLGCPLAGRPVRGARSAAHAGMARRPRRDPQGLSERRQAETDLEALRTRERDAREPVTDELVALGADPQGLQSLSLAELVEAALEAHRRHLSGNQERARLVAERDKAREELERRKGALAQASEARTSWQERWNAALADIGLRADVPPEAVEAQLELIERARAAAARIASLLESIAGSRRALAAFERSASELAERIARDLATTPAEEALVEIENRLTEAERVHGLREAKQAEARALDARIEERRKLLARAASSVAHLMQAARVDSTKALREAIDRSDRRRALEAERMATAAKLSDDGDGNPIEVLEAECADVDLDEAAAKEATIQSELEALQSRLAAAAEDRSRARDAFEAVGGSDAAVHAAADREDALAELRDISERYVRARGSALMLEWAVDRYRRERQAPLLSRAEELFRTLTAGSFTDLRVDYDTRDRPCLVGIRPEGDAVPVPGLSAGTADQLYLALRVAAVEEYLATAAAMPFIADDLLINFDDARAAAGLEVLERLSHRTQVLFFTHHRHLVGLARTVLGSSCHVVDLGSETARVPRKAA